MEDAHKPPCEDVLIMTLKKGWLVYYYESVDQRSPPFGFSVQLALERYT
jgi:hypothetical protein